MTLNAENIPVWVLPGIMVALMSIGATIWGIIRSIERHRAENATREYVDGALKSHVNTTAEIISKCQAERDQRFGAWTDERREIWKKVDETREIIGNVAVSVGRIEGRLIMNDNKNGKGKE